MAQPLDRSGKTGSEALARAVRERREELGLTRQELADAAGIPYPTIAQIETAYRGVSPARLGVIARVLALDPKELYELLAAEDAGDADVPPSAPVQPTEPAGARRASSTWHANPRFVTAARSAAMPAAAAAPRSAPCEGRSRDRTPDVVEQLVELVRTLPVEHRLDVVTELQRRTLEEVVRDRLEQGR